MLRCCTRERTVGELDAGGTGSGVAGAGATTDRIRPVPFWCMTNVPSDYLVSIGEGEGDRKRQMEGEGDGERQRGTWRETDRVGSNLNQIIVKSKQINSNACLPNLASQREIDFRV